MAEKDNTKTFETYQSGGPPVLTPPRDAEGPEKPLRIITLSTTVTGEFEQNVFGALSHQALELSHITESQMVSNYPYDDNEEATGEYFDENTLFKVADAIEQYLETHGMYDLTRDVQVRQLISTMQNAGILFRERR